MEYIIKQSLEEVKYAYSRLIDKLDEHMKILKDNEYPFIRYVGMKRALLLLKLDYLSQKAIKGNKMKESEELLANKILQNFNIDITGAIQVGLVGEREMKRALILKAYDGMAKEGKKYKDIKQLLSKEYGVSVSSIEKMVYAKPPSISLKGGGKRPPSVPPEGGGFYTINTKTNGDRPLALRALPQGGDKITQLKKN